MPYCCVFKCSNIAGLRFPKDSELKKAWIHAVRRKDWSPSNYSIVCYDHFKPDDFIKESYYHGTQNKKKILKRGTIPSVFLWSRDDSGPSTRQLRLNAREFQKQETMSHDVQQDTSVGMELPIQDDLEIKEEHDNSLLEDLQPPKTCDTEAQTTESGLLGPVCAFSIERFKDNDRSIKFFTGLECYEKFKMVLATLGPAAYELNYYQKFNVKSISIENQFFLTLIKLKQNKCNYELSLFFEVSESVVNTVFITWLNFMSLQWRELNIWSAEELVIFFKPESYRFEFVSTGVTVDGTELAVVNCNTPSHQQSSSSIYKNHNSVKVEVGSTPGGLISNCSEAYCGSTSDRQLLERRDIIVKCESGDSILADKGFNVQDLFAPKGVKINMSTFRKGTAKLPGEKVISDTKIGNKRFNIERLIGLAKIYKIMCQPLHSQYQHFASEIAFTCVMLCNFCSNIVGNK